MLVSCVAGVLQTRCCMSKQTLNYVGVQETLSDFWLMKCDLAKQNEQSYNIWGRGYRILEWDSIHHEKFCWPQKWLAGCVWSMLARGLNQPENSYCSNAQQWLLTGNRCNLVRQTCVLRFLWQWDQRAFLGMVWCWQANTSILHKKYDTDFDY